ncbi:nitroreductase [Aureisphaera galaxeae]|uniref:nitroreductase family protein n=1 Tax=Aureisphaera galaxeae TaxID=1538023 RepID=UPI0023500885|nr:nitroreductase [Aureisphaera galaxeae]MDC8002850.1 nitroreductase [Aureisphaera galaxeae]
MILDIIEKRRAVFPVQYNNNPISEEELNTILQAANWAPTHRRTEPWRFKVFHSDTARKGLSEFLGKMYQEITDPISETKLQKTMDKPLQSGCVMAICMQRDPKESVPEWEEVAATAMAVQNMWLTARSLGIGCYWSSPALKDHIGKHIELPEGEKCLGFFYMGKFDGELPEGVRKSTIAEKTVWV